ncbi:MAG: ABC transporter permease, partial [Deltaproteobacteria bacterium]
MKLYNISLNNLRRRKGKVIFLVSGLLIGIATIVTLISITQSMSRDVEERLDRFGANIVMTPRSENLSLSYGGITVGGVNYQTVEFMESDLANIRDIKNSQHIGIIAPKVLGPWEMDGKRVLLMGADLQTELSMKTWWQFDGMPTGSPDDLIVGSEAARIFGLALGDPLKLGTDEFVVSTILHPTGGPEDGIIVGDLHRFQKVLGKPGRISMVEISAF